MADQRAHSAAANGATANEKTYFEQQRELLVGQIASSLEHVLQEINKLNRSLEGIIAVGDEFGSVEALWSQFENVMATNEDGVEAKTREEDRENGQDGEASETGPQVEEK